MIGIPRSRALLLCLALSVPGLAVGCDDPPPVGPGTDGGTDSGADPADTGPMPEVDGGPPGAARTSRTSGGAIAISDDGTLAVATNRQAGTIAVFDVVGGATPSATRRALLELGDAEPWAVVLSADGNTAYVILRRDHQLIRVSGLRGTPQVDMTRVTTGSEPTGIAISPTGSRIYVAAWAEGVVNVIDAVAMTSAGTVDLNASLAGTGRLGTVTSRPALAHPRAIAVTNDGDMDDADETVYVTEFFGQARLDTLPADDSAFDVAKEGLVYRFAAGSLAVAAPIVIAPVADTGFLDSAGNTTGCYPNQLGALALREGRLHVTALCASPRGPTGPVFDGGGALTSAANFSTQVHTSIFAIDLAANAEVPAERVVLTQAFRDHYVAASVPDTGARRMPLIATDFDFVPGSRIGYLTGYGSDAVFRVVYAEDNSLQAVGSSAANFIDLAPAGRLPLGIAIAGGTTPMALVVNETTRSVSVISFATQTAIASAESSPLPTAGSPEAHLLDGRRFFVTGLGRWSLRGQAWNSCESCHTDGLTDNVTWYFPRGPRQSTSLDGTYDSTDPSERRILNWTAIFDEVHDFELNTRGNSGGLGALVHTVSSPPTASDRIDFDGPPAAAGEMSTATPQQALNGSTAAMMPDGSGAVRSVLADWDHIAEYVQSIRSPRAPVTLDAADVAAGRTLFEANNCAGCHGTSMWTISRVFYTPGEDASHPTTGRLRSSTYTLPSGFPAVLNPPAAAGPATLRFPAGPTAGAQDQIQCVVRAVGTFPATGTDGVAPTGVLLREVRADMSTPAQGSTGFNPPALLGAIVGAPYFHGGNARTLEESFSDDFAAHHGALSVNFLMTGDRAEQVRQITAFLLSIDEDTAPVSVPTSLGYDPVLCPDTF